MLITTIVQRRKLRAETERIKAEKGKTDADAAKIVAETAAGVMSDLIGPLRVDLARHRKKLEETQTEIEALRRHLAVVEALLRENGIPVPAFVWPHVNGGQH